MSSLSRSILCCAPFVATLTIAAVCSAADPDLGTALASPSAPMVALNQEAPRAEDGPLTDPPTLSSGLAVSLAGATGVGPAALTVKSPDLGSWQDFPVKR